VRHIITFQIGVIALLLLGLEVSAANEPDKESYELPLNTGTCSFTGTFEQVKTLAGLPEPLVSNGVFYYHCDRGVIWKTQQPVSESLVFQKLGQAYKVNDGQSVRLKSRQGKLLGQLLNNLISGDTARLETYFELSQSNEQQLHLKPKKPSIKRAIKTIVLETHVGPFENADHAVKISLVDRNQQLTEIVSVQTERFDATTDYLEQCSAHPALSELECRLVSATRL